MIEDRLEPGVPQHQFTQLVVVGTPEGGLVQRRETSPDPRGRGKPRGDGRTVPATTEVSRADICWAPVAFEHTYRIGDPPTVSAQATRPVDNCGHRARLPLPT